MASKAANLEKQVECPICLEQFKEPKVLSCLHSYCKSCLQKYVTKTSDEQHKITCPECRQETQVLPNHQVVGCLQWHYWHNTKIMICISPIFAIFLLFLASLFLCLRSILFHWLLVFLPTLHRFPPSLPFEFDFFLSFPFLPFPDSLDFSFPSCVLDLFYWSLVLLHPFRV